MVAEAVYSFVLDSLSCILIRERKHWNGNLRAGWRMLGLVWTGYHNLPSAR
jgi:hypothetical protein